MRIDLTAPVQHLSGAKGRLDEIALSGTNAGCF
jgi:hypothetical protein